MSNIHERAQRNRNPLVDLIHAARIPLTEHISERSRQPALLVRSFLTELCTALSNLSAKPLIDWARCSQGTYRAGQVLDLISIGFSALFDLLESTDTTIDHATLIVFSQIVIRDVGISLQLDTETALYSKLNQPSDVEPVLTMLRYRDEATCTHSRLTGVWCRRIVEALGLDSVTADRTVIAGVLHDIGKIATPDAVLLKPGPLDETEWEIMRAHASLGADLLLDIPGLAEYAPIVRAHHERIDGAGYPYGLIGDQIPLEARIIAVADAFHAITSARPYRQALSIGKAIEILQAGRGTQWEGRIVDVMVAVAIEIRNVSSEAELREPMTIIP